MRWVCVPAVEEDDSVSRDGVEGCVDEEPDELAVESARGASALDDAASLPAGLGVVDSDAAGDGAGDGAIALLAAAFFAAPPPPADATGVSVISIGCWFRMVFQSSFF